MHCPDCDRDFGGTDAYERHVDRRKDRCRTDRELRQRDLFQHSNGSWHRRAARQKPLPGFGPESAQEPRSALVRPRIGHEAGIGRVVALPRFSGGSVVGLDGGAA